MTRLFWFEDARAREVIALVTGLNLGDLAQATRARGAVQLVPSGVGTARYSRWTRTRTRQPRRRSRTVDWAGGSGRPFLPSPS